MSLDYWLRWHKNRPVCGPFPFAYPVCRNESPLADFTTNICPRLVQLGNNKTCVFLHIKLNSADSNFQKKLLTSLSKLLSTSGLIKNAWKHKEGTYHWGGKWDQTAVCLFKPWDAESKKVRSEHSVAVWSSQVISYHKPSISNGVFPQRCLHSALSLTNVVRVYRCVGPCFRQWTKSMQFLSEEMALVGWKWREGIEIGPEMATNLAFLARDLGIWSMSSLKTAKRNGNGKVQSWLGTRRLVHNSESKPCSLAGLAFLNLKHFRKHRVTGTNGGDRHKDIFGLTDEMQLSSC